MEDQVIESEKPQENMPSTEANETTTSETKEQTSSVHWCKPKMTTSLPASTQAVIRELAPSQVDNISKFIHWILEEYASLQALHEQYTTLQKEYASLQALHEQYTTLQKASATAPELTDNPTPSKPAITEQPKKKQMTYLQMIGLE